VSYILDALKRSDQERKKGGVPNLQSQPEQLDPPAPAPFKPTRNYVLLWLFPLVLAVLLVWILTSSTTIQNGKPAAPVNAANPAGNQSVDVKPIVEIEAPSQDEGSGDENYLNQVKGVQLEISPVGETGIRASQAPAKNTPESTVSMSGERVVEAAPPREASQSETGVNKSNAEARSDSDADRYQGIPHQRQLAFDLQRAIPDLAISVHLFSAAPSSRLVRINNTIYREGDLIDSELKLEEITPDGVILSFRNKRFWRHVR
jgi:general secretion pathway protein B